jgi:hypothetical protein
MILSLISATVTREGRRKNQKLKSKFMMLPVYQHCAQLHKIKLVELVQCRHTVSWEAGRVMKLPLIFDFSLITTSPDKSLFSILLFVILL